MPVMDEFKEERAAVKNGTPKQKIAYFIDYYKWYVVFGAAVLIFGAVFLYQVSNNKKPAFYAMLINAAPLDYSAEAENTDAFGAYAEIDPEKYNIIYDTSVQLGSDAGTDYYSAQQILVHVSAAEVDVMVSDAASLLQYAYMGDFCDLRTVLSPEQLEAYSDSFYYIDGAVLKEVEAARKDYDHEYIPVYGDPAHPEDMQDPIPAGLFLPSDCPLLEAYLFQGSDPAVSILINAPHPETAVRFLDYLSGQPGSFTSAAVPSAVR